MNQKFERARSPRQLSSTVARLGMGLAQAWLALLAQAARPGNI
jgi:hypothetical protein